MNGQYYKKDKRVKLIRRYETQTPGGYAQSHYKYLTAGSIWAYTRQLSQEQIFQAQAYGSAESRLFVLNYRSDLKLYDIVEYGDNYYSIERLDTTDDYKTELFVYVSNTRRGDTPSQEEIEPYTDESQIEQGQGE